MKIAIVAPTPVPFSRGGAERAWTGLYGALLDAGHEAEMVKVPVRESTLAEVAAGYRAFAALDLDHFDVVISSKYPAWICSHPRHVLWMFHPLRGLYDTYGHFGIPTAPGPVQPATAALLDAVGQPTRRSAVGDVLDHLDAAVAALGADHPDLALPGPVSRLVVRWLDRVALDPTEIARHVALSRTVATRADYLPEGVGARVAHAPSDLVPPRPGGGPRSHLFTASRLDHPKRLDLLIRAMAHVPGEVPLLIGGTGPDEARLRALAGGDPRIRFAGFVPDDELADLYGAAVAVPFVPLDEDYGLIAVEAMAAGAPVVTCTDSGGPAELITNGSDGLVVTPDPVALGRALAALVADPERAARLGTAARRRAARISWPAAIRTLLGSTATGTATTGIATTGTARSGHAPNGAMTSRATTDGAMTAATGAAGSRAATAGSGPRARTRLTEHRARHGDRARVVVTTTFRVADRGHGGQLRSYHLYGALARHADVEIVSLTDGGPAGTTVLGPGFVETAVPISDAQRRAAEAQTLAVGVPVSDLTAGSEIALTPEYLRVLRAATRDADVVILAEPYLLPALDGADVALPFVYDAFNVEADLKAEVLPPGAAGTAVWEQVVAVERAAARRAAAITACSRADAETLAAGVGRPGTDARVVPNGTDCAALCPPSPEVRRRRGEQWVARYRSLDRRASGVTSLAVFFGSWHPPNLVAAEILIELAAAVPEVLFVLGGRHGDAFAARPTPPNVVFVGVVADRERDVLLRAAHVALNPMVSGSGTNLKVIEYLAAGVPVVTTDVGARGLDVVDGEHLLVVSPSHLARAIRTVVADPAAAAQRAAAGRDLVERRYDWPGLGDALADVVDAIRRR